MESHSKKCVSQGVKLNPNLNRNFQDTFKPEPEWNQKVVMVTGSQWNDSRYLWKSVYKFIFCSLVRQMTNGISGQPQNLALVHSAALCAISISCCIWALYNQARATLYFWDKVFCSLWATLQEQLVRSLCQRIFQQYSSVWKTLAVTSIETSNCAAKVSKIFVTCYGECIVMFPGGTTWTIHTVLITSMCL